MKIEKQITFNEFINLILQYQCIDDSKESELYYLFEFIRLCFNNKELQKLTLYPKDWWIKTKKYDVRAQKLARKKFNVQYKIELY